MQSLLCYLNLKSGHFLFNLNLKSEYLKYCSLGPKTEVQDYDSGAKSHESKWMDQIHMTAGTLCFGKTENIPIIIEGPPYPAQRQGL